MYDIDKVAEFRTVGDIRDLLAGVSDDAQILVCGDSTCFFHVEEDGSVVNFDTEDLEDVY